MVMVVGMGDGYMGMRSNTPLVVSGGEVLFHVRGIIQRLVRNMWIR